MSFSWRHSCSSLNIPSQTILWQQTPLEAHQTTIVSVPSAMGSPRTPNYLKYSRVWNKNIVNNNPRKSNSNRKSNLIHSLCRWASQSISTNSRNNLKRFEVSGKKPRSPLRKKNNNKFLLHAFYHNLPKMTYRNCVFNIIMPRDMMHKTIPFLVPPTPPFPLSIFWQKDFPLAEKIC